MNLFTVLFVVLLVLKLTGYIAVSWWIVFAPLIVGWLFFSAWAFIVFRSTLHAKRSFNRRK